MGGELGVDLSECLQFAFDLFLVKGVEEDPDVLLAVEGDTGRLASDGSWVALLSIK